MKPGYDHWKQGAELQAQKILRDVESQAPVYHAMNTLGRIYGEASHKLKEADEHQRAELALIAVGLAAGLLEVLKR